MKKRVLAQAAGHSIYLQVSKFHKSCHPCLTDKRPCGKTIHLEVSHYARDGDKTWEIPVIMPAGSYNLQ